LTIITTTDQPKEEKPIGSSSEAAPGIRLEMVARNSSCAGIPLVGPESRILRIQCALERSARRLSHLLAGQKYSSTNFLRSVAADTTVCPHAHIILLDDKLIDLLKLLNVNICMIIELSFDSP
jgi:hypothetical protein